MWGLEWKDCGVFESRKNWGIYIRAQMPRSLRLMGNQTCHRQSGMTQNIDLVSRILWLALCSFNDRLSASLSPTARLLLADMGVESQGGSRGRLTHFIYPAKISEWRFFWSFTPTCTCTWELTSLTSQPWPSPATEPGPGAAYLTDRPFIGHANRNRFKIFFKISEFFCVGLDNFWCGIVTHWKPLCLM